MNLTSGLLKSYKKAFIVDEDALRRIQGILQKASSDLAGNSQVVFHIDREDDRYYETTNVEDVLADPNMPGKRINKVRVELRRKQDDHHKSWPYSDNIVEVMFSIADTEPPFPQCYRVFVRITSDDKNWALLLADQLQPQVERTFRVKATPRWLLVLFALPFILALLKVASFNVVEVPDISVLIFYPMMFAILLFIFGKVFGLPHWFIKVFGPESAFLWGEEAQAYPEREQMRRQILWGVNCAV